MVCRVCFSGFLPPSLCTLCALRAKTDDGASGASFAFPEDHVDNATEEGQGKGHPGQDVGEAVGVVTVDMPLTVPHRVDGRRTHHAQTSEDLEESGDVKAASFGESEELAEEEEQRQDAEDDRQDHGGLDRLQPFAR